MSYMKQKFFDQEHTMERHRAVQSRLAVQAIRSLTYLVEHIQTGWEYNRELEEAESALHQIRENDKLLHQENET